jgi:hypothetical protein
MDKQRKHTRYSKIHMARRLKSTLTDLYVDGKVADYLVVVRKYNQLVKTL